MRSDAFVVVFIAFCEKAKNILKCSVSAFFSPDVQQILISNGISGKFNYSIFINTGIFLSRFSFFYNLLLFKQIPVVSFFYLLNIRAVGKKNTGCFPALAPFLRSSHYSNIFMNLPWVVYFS